MNTDTSIIRIYYGTADSRINVSEAATVAFRHAHWRHWLCIPAGDMERWTRLQCADPVPFVVKSLWVNDTEIVADVAAYVDVRSGTAALKEPEDIAIYRRLQQIHSDTPLRHGNWTDELPEQLMSLRFLTGREKGVLELGANVGRNTLVISSIFRAAERPDTDIVALDCSPTICQQLAANRYANGRHFFIEPAALSNKPLAQIGWNTIELPDFRELPPPGHIRVRTLTWSQLKHKYSRHTFDTLVVDCEGAFYGILRDMPELLDDIQLIIVENDYAEIEKKRFVDNTLMTAGFNCIYTEAGGWGPCASEFYQVWRRLPQP